MKFLLCAEFFHPSVGGVQEVVKQIGIGLIKLGHEVTVATTKLDARITREIHGIKIIEFSISGNLVRGISGEVKKYQEFIVNSEFDAILIYAAQQWTCDCLLDYLDNIKARKILVPCGFSGFYLPEYKNYFKRLKTDIKLFDSLVFHSKEYRDYEFALKAGAKNLVLIPNGASSEEFLNKNKSNDFRIKNDIPEDAFLIMTNGSVNGAKGHFELARSIKYIDKNRKIFVVMNGNIMPAIKTNIFRKILSELRAMKELSIVQSMRRITWHLLRVLGLRSYAVHKHKLHEFVEEFNLVNQKEKKHLLSVDLPRSELIDCYFSADLFVFASMIEYSPLVLFESAAAGLPFLTSPVGNVEEIIKWTGAGKIYPATIDESGRSVVDPVELAKNIDLMIEDESSRLKMSKSGRENFKKYFNWEVLINDYEKVLTGRPVEQKEFLERSGI